MVFDFRFFLFYYDNWLIHSYKTGATQVSYIYYIIKQKKKMLLIIFTSATGVETVKNRISNIFWEYVV